MSRRTHIVAALVAIAFAIGLADGTVVRNGWVSWDDEITLYANPDFNPPTWATLGKIWSEQRAHLYVPITYTYWWLLASATWSPTGLSPGVFHASSLALHAVAAWLVFAIASRLTRSVAAACFGAILFAVHPVQVETVSWASGTKDLLAGALSLAAIWLFLMRHSAVTPRGRLVWMAGATLAYVFALFAKPSTVVVPLLLLVLEWLAVRSIAHDARLTFASWLVLALPVIALTRSIQPAIDVVVPPVWLRPIVALDAIGFYIKSIVWPMQLAFVYGRAPDVQLASPWSNMTVTIATAIALVFVARRSSVILPTTAIFVVAVLPYLGFTPFDFQAYSTVSDHYLYLAMLGPALLLAYVLKDRSAGWWAACGAVLVLLGLLSHEQAQVWRGKMSLLRHAVAMCPDRSPPRTALAEELERRNDLAEAEREYRLAIEISPHNAHSQTKLAQLLARTGRHAESVKHYREALAVSPRDTLKMNNLAIGLASTGQTEEAIDVLRAALLEADDSKDDLLHGNLGRLLLSQGKFHEARVELQQAIVINPDLENARRGLELIQQSEERGENQ